MYLFSSWSSIGSLYHLRNLSAASCRFYWHKVVYVIPILICIYYLFNMYGDFSYYPFIDHDIGNCVFFLSSSVWLEVYDFYWFSQTSSFALIDLLYCFPFSMSLCFTLNLLLPLFCLLDLTCSSLSSFLRWKLMTNSFTSCRSDLGCILSSCWILGRILGYQTVSYSCAWSGFERPGYVDILVYNKFGNILGTISSNPFSFSSHSGILTGITPHSLILWSLFFSYFFPYISFWLFSFAISSS